MMWEFWRVFAGAVVFCLLMGVWMLVKIRDEIGDLVDVLAVIGDDDEAEVEECTATRRLPGTALAQPGHLHSCALTIGHDRQHHCPVCRLNWSDLAKGGPVRAGLMPVVGDQDGGAS